MTEIHNQLRSDCIVLGRLQLCHLLLMNDAQYPWLILVPDREGITEIFQLSVEDQQQLIMESSFIGQQMMALFGGDKLNVAALGNVVPQLHIHHIVRYRNDAAWPAPVWGKQAPQPYTETDRAEVIRKIRLALGTRIELDPTI